MPKLAERYNTKYGFQCLEKNVTRFEAEHAFQISPEPLAVEDLNQYIVMANREHNLLYDVVPQIADNQRGKNCREEEYCPEKIPCFQLQIQQCRQRQAQNDLKPS